MSRFSGKNWMQDEPLARQLFIKLSLGGTIACAAGAAYMTFVVFPGSRMTAEQWIRCGFLYAMAMIANLFLSRVLTAQITEPFEKLAENMSRIRKKNWKEKIYQASRKDEVGQIINALSAIQTNVTEINEDEELFYQSVSHGLKTPIMVIRNCCMAYQDGVYGGEAVDIIMKESLMLEAGIKKLLYVSSFDHMLGKRSDFLAVDLSKLCRKCVGRFAPNVKGACLLLDVPDNCVVEGNEPSLETLFGNILENAIRYMRQKVTVRLTAETDSYTVIFENDGDPIPQKTMDILFDKFYKGPEGSFGLGLYIARKIAAFHGGDIWAKNVETGVQFYVMLKKPPEKQENTDGQIEYAI